MQVHVCNPACMFIHTHALCVHPGSHVHVTHVDTHRHILTYVRVA